MRIDGARALVTGASSGIGAATVRRLARPLLVGRDEQALAALAGETGGSYLVADLREPDASERIADWAGDVDLLVCNAGIGWAGPLDGLSPAGIAELVTVNLTAHLSCWCPRSPAVSVSRTRRSTRRPRPACAPSRTVFAWRTRKSA